MTSSLSVNKLFQSIVLMSMNTLYPTSIDLFTMVKTKISINDSFTLQCVFCTDGFCRKPEYFVLWCKLIDSIPWYTLYFRRSEGYVSEAEYGNYRIFLGRGRLGEIK